MRCYVKGLCGLILIFSCPESLAINYTWAGTTSRDWATASNWLPAGVPNAADNVSINTAVLTPLLNASHTIVNLSIFGGAIDLNGFTLTTTGTTVFDGGQITNGTINSSGPISVFSGTTFGAVVNATSETISLDGSTFNNTANFVSSNSLTQAGDGGNIFNATTTFTHNGSGWIFFDEMLPNIFNGTVIATNTSTGRIQLVYFSNANQFNGNVVVNNTNPSPNSGISIGGIAGVFGTSTLAPARTISIGAQGFESGSLSFTAFTQTGTTPQTLNLAGTAALSIYSSVFNADVAFVAPHLTSRGVVYNGSALLTQTGVNSGSSLLDNNTYNGATTITNNSSNQAVLIGNTTPDTFNADVTLTSNGASIIAEGGCRFNGDMTLNNYSTSGIYLHSDATTETIFNGDITLNNTGNGAIYFGERAVASARLTSGNSIQIGSDGFNSGWLYITHLVQEGTAAQSLHLTGTASLTVGPAATFNGNVNYVAPQLFLSYGTYNGSASLTKSGAAENRSPGGNVFNGITSITNNGSADLVLGSNNFTDVLPDIFNEEVTFTNGGSASIYIAYSSIGCLFNRNVTLTNVGTGSAATGIFMNGTPSGTSIYAGNIIVNNTSAGGIYFENTFTLANTRTIGIGGAGFSNGTLEINNLTQTGTTPQSLSLTGTALLRLVGSTFNGNINFVAPRLSTTSCRYNGTAYLEKSGGGTSSGGGNTFSSMTTIVGSGSGDLFFGVTSADIFNGALTITNPGTAAIRMANNTTGNQFNENIIVNQANGTGIFFGQAGSAILAAGRTVTTSAFSGGTLGLENFTQTGSTAQGLTLTGGATLFIANSTFNGAVNFSAPRLTVTTSTFHGAATLTKTGAGTDLGSGPTAFNGVATITNSGSGSFEFRNAPVFNNDVIINNTGTSRVVVGTSAGMVMNGTLTINHQGNSTASTLIANGGSATISGNVTLHSGNANTSSGIVIGSGGNVAVNGNIVASSASGRGIYFGDPTGTVTIGTGRTITATPGMFTSGTLSLQGVVFSGSTPQQIALSGTATLNVSSSTFSGAVEFAAPQLLFSGSTFNSTAVLEKTGGGDNTSASGCTFNGPATITNSGPGLLRLNSSDNFQSDVTFVKTGSGELEPAYNFPSTVYGNLTVASATPITFGGGGGGGVLLRGANNQVISKTGSANPIFAELTVFKSPGSRVTLNTGITITRSFLLFTRVIHSSAANPITLADNATVDGASNSSYVEGPVIKIGDDAFTFPVGRNGLYRPISISAPSSITDSFTAEYIDADADALYPTLNKDANINHVSRCEYWYLNRTNGSSPVNVSLSWDSNSCGVDNLTDLRVARWDGTGWRNHGNGSTTGTTAAGTISTSGSVTSFSPFTLASASTSNPLPIELLDLAAEPNGNSIEIYWSTASELNNDYFLVEKSSDGSNFTIVEKTPGAGNSTTIRRYSVEDRLPFAGKSYYRLRQVDFDGRNETSKVISVNYEPENGFRFSLSPNPSGTDVNLSFTGIHDTIEEMEINVIDMKGVSVFSKKVQSSEINAGFVSLTISRELPTGVYVVCASTGKTTWKQKLFVMH